MDIQMILSLDDRLTAVLQHVRAAYDVINHGIPDHLYEHGLSHIGRVVRNSLIISYEERLNTFSQSLLMAAALCHDLGYITDPDHHVAASVDQATPILRAAKFTPTEIEEIGGIIMAHSASGSAPRSTAEKTLYVADKCDLLGYDGLVRQILHNSRTFADRDELCANLLVQAEQLYCTLRDINIGCELVRQRWTETLTVLGEVGRRRFALDGRPDARIGG